MKKKSKSTVSVSKFIVWTMAEPGRIVRSLDQHIDEMQEPEPNNFADFVVPMKFI